MFKKEISFISDLNLNKLHTLGNRLKINDINKSNLHPAIIKFVNAAIDKEIFSDREQMSTNSVFNYRGDRFDNYFSLISDEIKRTQNFDANYIKHILQNAVIFNVNYLTQTNNTLINFVFGNFEVKSVNEIIINLSHVYYYKYLQKILFTYFDKKKTIFMQKEEFSQLLNRVDQLSLENHFEDTITTAINSIANFFDQNSKFSEKLPLDAVKLFLEEKQMPEFIAKLNSKFGNDNTSLVSSNDIIYVLMSVTPVSEIVIEDTTNIEDEFVEDNSESKPENEKTNQNDQLLEIKEEHKDFSFEEVTEEEIEIPNDEILSNIEKVETHVNENKVDIEKENIIIELNKSSNSPSSDDENFSDKIEKTDKLNEINKLEEDKKKKPEVKSVIKKLIDTFKIFDKYIPVPIPFQSEKKSFNISELSSKIADETNYQIDLSTLNEEIETKADNYSQTNQSISTQNDATTEKNTVNYDESPEDLLNNYEKSETNLTDINERMDEFVTNNSTEEEYIEEIGKDSIIDLDQDEKQVFENLIDEESLTLSEDDEEEVTEVFKDLTYLEQEEEINEETTKSNEENLIEQKEVEDNNSEINKENKYIHYSFSDLIVSKEMTKIIEAIFDYDMEDYHSMINKISESLDESEAIKIIETYCNINNIEISSKEVEEFKSYIIEYFTKTYS